MFGLDFRVDNLAIETCKIKRLTMFRCGSTIHPQPNGEEISSKKSEDENKKFKTKLTPNTSLF